MKHNSAGISETDVIAYIRQLGREESAFKGQSQQDGPEVIHQRPALTNMFQIGWLVVASLIDVTLLLLCKSNWKGKTLVFTAPNFCIRKNNAWIDRIAFPVLQRQVIYLNQSKQYRLDKINGRKVYNTGGLVILLSKWKRYHPDRRINLFCCYRRVNDFILKSSRAEAVTLCFYDLNGLSLAFSSCRNDFRITEIQHGSILNYPPYALPAPVAVADTFYVRNHPTAAYLRDHLCRHFKPEFRLIPYPAVHRAPAPGWHIFYASTVEFGGFHPVFKEFLAKTPAGELHLTVRLHPRERGQEEKFLVKNPAIRVRFDTTDHWLEGDLPANTVVVSPWSSCIEEACDNGFQTVVIDPVGEKRYHNLILAGKCSYAENAAALLELLFAHSV